MVERVLLAVMVGLVALAMSLAAWLVFRWLREHVVRERLEWVAARTYLSLLVGKLGEDADAEQTVPRPIKMERLLAGSPLLKYWEEEVAKMVAIAFEAAASNRIFETIKGYFEEARGLEDQAKRLQDDHDSKTPPARQEVIVPECELMAKSKFKRRMWGILPGCIGLIALLAVAVVLATIDALAIFLTFKVMFKGTANGPDVILLSVTSCVMIIVIFVGAAHHAFPILRSGKGSRRGKKAAFTLLNWLGLVGLALLSVFTACVRIKELVTGIDIAAFAIGGILTMAIPAISLTVAWLCEVIVGVVKKLKEECVEARTQLRNDAPTLLAKRELQAAHTRRANAERRAWARDDGGAKAKLTRASSMYARAGSEMRALEDTVLDGRNVQAAIQSGVNAIVYGGERLIAAGMSSVAEAEEVQ